MNIVKEVLGQVTSLYQNNYRSNNNYSNHGNQNDHRVYEYENYNKELKPRSDGFSFFVFGVCSAIFFIGFGIYEVLFRSPLASWTKSVWQSIAKTSPQTLIELPNQIAGTDSFMQKNISDWLGLVPGSLGQVWAIIISPIGAVIGLILVLVAFGIRLAGKFFKRQQTRSNKLSLKIISWLLLVGSFFPIILEYVF